MPWSGRDFHAWNRQNNAWHYEAGHSPTIFQPGSEWSKLRQLYGEKKLSMSATATGMKLTQIIWSNWQRVAPKFFRKDDKGVRMEILALKDHPWYVGVQFHPEYLSHVLQPSRPYLGFVAAAAGCLEWISKEIVMAEGHAGLNCLVNGTLSNGISGVSILIFNCKSLEGYVELRLLLVNLD